MSKDVDKKKSTEDMKDFKSADLPHVERKAYPNRNRITMPRSSMYEF